jgi:hypothetical protein
LNKRLPIKPPTAPVTVDVAEKGKFSITTAKPTFGLEKTSG